MAVGIQPDKAAVDNTAGSLARDLNNQFLRVQAFKAWLDGKPDAELIATYGYTSGEVATLKSAYADLDQLRTIYQGSANLATAKNFRTFADDLWGFGLP